MAKTGLYYKNAVPPRSPAPRETNALGELKRVAFLGIALCLVLAFVSFSPSDPSWTTWNTKNDVHNWMGRFGSLIADLNFLVFGVGGFSLVFLILSSALRNKKEEESSLLTKISPLLFVLSICTLFQAALPSKWIPWEISYAGGLLGKYLLEGFRYLLGNIGSLVLAGFLFFASVILHYQINLLKWSAEIFRAVWNNAKVFSRFIFHKTKCLSRRLHLVLKGEKILSYYRGPRPSETQDLLLLKEPLEEDDKESLEKREIPEQLEMESHKSFSPFKLLKKKTSSPPPLPKKNPDGSFALPGLDLLKSRDESEKAGNEKAWYLEKGKILIEKLRDFGVEGEIVNVCPGPVITVYEFKPASGVKIREISNLSDDLTLALSVLSVRIVAPIPGKPVVGIEIPSQEREIVLFRTLLEETPFYNSKNLKVPILLGRLASGEPVATDLAKMPHLLVAGATGTGKSVFINTLIASLLYRFKPEDCKLILVDPKMVELNHYDGIPHLLLPVVVDSKKAVLALRWVVEEMERRYRFMHEAGVRHVDAYNEKLKTLPVEELEENAEAPTHLPYIVVVIDEYADLMAVVPKDLEHSVARLAQKARASGIHLVLATQRPSTDVVTGTIKANFPSRISFRVASAVDSKTILDRPGAERLLGNGDLLFYSAGFTSLKRMQGAFISDTEIEQVVEHLKLQGEPQYNESIMEKMNSDDEENELSYSSSGEGKDAQLYDAAVRLVTERGEASISLVQRHLKIGYNRAASLIEEMEKNGVVGESTGASKRRSVLVGSH